MIRRLPTLFAIFAIGATHAQTPGVPPEAKDLVQVGFHDLQARSAALTCGVRMRRFPQRRL